MRNYYVDTCIWLNLFKKEGDASRGMPYWQIAKMFLEQVNLTGRIIFVSTINLKELQFTLKEKFEDVEKFFKETNFIQIVKTTPEDYNLARKFEQEQGLLSFYDYLHVAIAKRLKSPLISRDKDLINFAKNYIEIFKPENLLR